jgi:hypothetical protein
LSQDPLGLAAGPNAYTYADGDPADATDPSGLIAWWAVGCAVGALVRDVGGALWGTKHTWTDFGKGALKGCAAGAMIGDGLGALKSARLAAEEAEGGVGARAAGERAAGGEARAGEEGIPRSTERPCNCFPAGTTVDTPDGPKRIEDVKVGDKVITHDLTTGQDQTRTVTALFHKQADDLLAITTDNQQFQVTPQHGFWIPDRGWTLAGTLHPGDHLLRRDGTTSTITTITHTHQPTTVYNLTITGDHNYYATNQDLLVHNCAGADDIKISSHAAQRMAERGITKEEVESALQKTPFSYWHDGQWKTGYYDSDTGIFVGTTIDGTVNTVLNNVTSAYIKRLQEARPGRRG